MSAGHNAAISVLARCFAGLSLASSFEHDRDPEAPDYSADFEPQETDDKIAALVELPSGDRYRITVEWLSEESP